jgi:predicted lipoprotein with Yx(FWY)xxD motif
MRRPFVYAAAFVGLALAGAACGSYGSPAGGYGGAGNAPAGNTPAGNANATVAVTTTGLGAFLVDSSGRTLYLFEADRGATTTCDGACAQAWPPLTTSGGEQAASGVSAADLGTSARRDGTTQVTYHGHPLYYYVADGKPGDTRGQGLNQFGAPWYVVSPAGAKVDNG